MMVNTYSMKQPVLYCFEAKKNDVTNLVKVHREYSPVARILHTKFQNSIDLIIYQMTEATNYVVFPNTATCSQTENACIATSNI